MQINGRSIGGENPPYVIAEMSGNHQGSLEKALMLLERCAESGADAFKLQTYTADSLTVNSTRKEYIVEAGPWQGRTLYDLYSEGHTPREWVEPLLQRGKELGIAVFSSPFSIDDVNFLENLGVPAYKIASFEINFEQLFLQIAKTRKPIIFSTGLATLSEINAATSLLRSVGTDDFAILKCTTSYPAQLKDLNLSTIEYLARQHEVPIGFSDHTEGFVASVSAVALGATIIEKHVKLDDDDTSVDSTFSLPVSQLSNFIAHCRSAQLAIGKIQDGPTNNEVPYLKYRRSIVANRDIPSGETTRESDFSIVRPDIGLAPRYLDSLIGKVTGRDIKRGEGIVADMFEV
jgi:N-acetylneuraminate synthase